MGCGTSKPTVINTNKSTNLVKFPKKKIGHEISTTADDSRLYDSDVTSSMVPEFNTAVEPTDSNWYYDGSEPVAEENSAKAEDIDASDHVDLQQKIVRNLENDFIGRIDILGQILEYITGPPQHVPLLLHGEPGEGKTSLLAKVVGDREHNSSNGQHWHVFYYFVRVIPGSGNLYHMLRRLVLEIGAATEFTVPESMTELVQLSYAALSNPLCKPMILVMDAVDQFDDFFEDDDVVRWIPKQLSSKVRLVCSTETGTAVHQKLKERIPSIKEVHILPPSPSERQELIKTIMHRLGKELSADQVVCLSAKQSSANLLWLNLACDELAAIEEDGMVTKRIEDIPPNIDTMLADVIKRFEVSGDRTDRLVAGFLFLLSFSAQGMLVSEMKWILGDESTIFPVHVAGLGDIKITFNRVYEQVAEERWNAVYQALRHYTRKLKIYVKRDNDGIDDEDIKLDLRHHAIKNAVRRMNFLSGDGDDDCFKITDTERKENKDWWHCKLSDYFELEGNDRKTEEFFYQVVKVGKQDQIHRCLTDWEILDSLLQDDMFSVLGVWKQVGGHNTMVDIYKESMKELEETEDSKELIAHRYSQLAKLLLLGEQYIGAKDLISRAIELQKRCRTNPNEELVEMYTLAGDIQHKYLHCTYKPITGGQRDQLRQLLRSYKDAIKIRHNFYFTKERHKYKMAMSQIKYVEDLYWWIHIGADKSFTENEARREAILHIEEAIRISREVKSYGMFAESVMTKAMLGGEEQLQTYTDALDACLKAYGENHLLTAKINYRLGEYFEKEKAYERAAKHYILNVKILNEVLGEDHPHAVEAHQILQRPKVQNYTR
ncbi:uncharacterized protein LOC102804188 [Saccoglossus kowalevskii]|uniref:Nephrocystin-3-like n=1 Tax=Saccoglossus kowalevskii TaxID=10224 RepID=A0ABM0LY16_SACKO|nr:PREDICTED: nephrocystin-3-like [Saccoglossus kowalevskii]